MTTKIKAPMWLFDRRLRATTLKISLFLIEISDGSKVPYRPTRWSSVLRMSRTTILQSIYELIESGYITKDHDDMITIQYETDFI